MGIKNFLKKDIIIFGSSIEGRKIYEILTEHNIKPLCYIDNDEFKIGTVLHGMNHLPVKELLNMNNYIVIIPSIYYKPMYKQLMEMNIKKSNVILFDFYYPEYELYDIPYRLKFYMLMHKYFIKQH